MPKKYFLILFVTFILIAGSETKAEIGLPERLSGKIVIDVNSNGEAWYINPNDLKRYYLGKPQDAFNILRELGDGIRNADLGRIPTGIISSNEIDSDDDGLHDKLEEAIGTNPQKKDSDDDGFNDKIEVENNYNPNGTSTLEIDFKFTEKHSGKIFLQTEKNGEAWYLAPDKQKKYYLSRPKKAFEIMRQFGLGINVNDLNKIEKGSLNIEKTEKQNKTTETENNYTENKYNKTEIMARVVDAIAKEDKDEIKSLFIPEKHKSIIYTIENASNETIVFLKKFLSEATLESSSEDKLVYKNTVFYNEKQHNIYFNIEKQENGKWLMTNL